MWLLSTSHTELRFFNSPEDVPGGYAILSHVWSRDEQTFQDTQALRERCARTGRNPRDLATDKIRKFCIFAERAGYQWVWADTCCIDKSSSAELSEAINSMYHYYAVAEVCYAYLVDVDLRSAPDAAMWRLLFRRSRWHQRGWTLQELIAPEVVVFLDKWWTAIGTKAELAELLEVATDVPRGVLMLETEVRDISIATRMSWAARRDTTRVEDEAYCLMGIFGVTMPTLYGEGRTAFRRLQEEIMKQSPDTSLFVWGEIHDFDELLKMERPATECDAGGHYEASSLLAPNPYAFKIRYPTKYTPHLKLIAHSTTTELPTFTITPYGILSRMPIIRTTRGVVGAMFFCTVADATDCHIVLSLAACSDSDANARNPLGTLYDVGITSTRTMSSITRNQRISTVRASKLHDLMQAGEVCIAWESVYLANRPLGSRFNESRILINRGLSAPFRIPRWLVRERDLQLLQSSSFMEFPWTGSTPAIFLFSGGRPDEGLALYLGRCSVPQAGALHRYLPSSLRRVSCSTSPPSPSSALSLPQRAAPDGAHWAKIVHHPGSRLSVVESSEHDCTRDHIRDWPEWSKFFMFRSAEDWMPSVYARVEFARSASNPDVMALKSLDVNRGGLLKWGGLSEMVDLQRTEMEKVDELRRKGGVVEEGEKRERNELHEEEAGDDGRPKGNKDNNVEVGDMGDETDSVQHNRNGVRKSEESAHLGSGHPPQSRLARHVTGWRSRMRVIRVQIQAPIRSVLSRLQRDLT